MKYVVIDKKVWSLQPVFLCKDKCFAPIDVDEVYKNKTIKFFIFKYNAIKIAKKYETCDVFSVKCSKTKKHRAVFGRVYKSKYSIENEKDRRIVELEEDAKVIAKENTELKEKLDKIRKYLVYDIFDRFKYLENLLKISQETQEELCKRIIEQQKTIGSLTDTIDEIKAYCKAVDEVNEKMKCCGNCKHEQDSNTDYYCEDCKRFANETDIEKNGSQQNEI